MKSNWLHKIQQQEATPPEGAWKNIANTLDNEAAENVSFAERLISFETPPPAAAQKNIFALLDVTSAPFEQRLQEYETVAPEDTWANIATVLEKRETKIIPLKTVTGKLKPFYVKRAAAAVAVIAVLSVTALFLSRRQSGLEEITTATTEQQQVPITLPGNTSAKQLPVSNTQAEKKQYATNKKTANSTASTNYTGTPSYISNSQITVLAQNPVTLKKEKLQDINGLTPQDVTLLNNTAANAYITISGPDGQSVRVSSKLAALINYLNDANPDTQENIEIIIKESAKWRATFSAWRDRMTNNNIAPSLTNFMDIIELSNVLEEKK